MDKIIYTCSAKHLSYVFPKRKWWDFSKKVREAGLEIRETPETEEIEIYVRILEEYPREVTIDFSEADKEKIRKQFAKQTLQNRRFEIFLVIDPMGDEFADMIVDFAEDINYFAVFTQNPENYEMVLEQLEREFGLIGMVFDLPRDFKRYLKTVSEGKRALIFTGNGLQKMENGENPCFFHFPKESLVIDFGEQEVIKKKFSQKRMGTDYVSLPIFLDNMVKNRYNSVVNEGLKKEMAKTSFLRQNVSRTEEKNRLSEKRKGIEKWKKRKIF